MPVTKETRTFQISSPSFENNGWIPDRHSAFYEDVSPQIILKGLDGRAVSLAIALDDMGHPIEPGYNHWIAWNIPPVDVIPEQIPKGALVKQPISIAQGLAYGKHCYRGPKPPFHWKHEYRFTVYALDTALAISTDSDKAAVLEAAEGHILQKGVLMGKYQRGALK